MAWERPPLGYHVLAGFIGTFTTAQTNFTGLLSVGSVKSADRLNKFVKTHPLSVNVTGDRT
jgi:hypothetical protein